jgi:thiol-disulfide isomerase/thioredoxin
MKIKIILLMLMFCSEIAGKTFKLDVTFDNAPDSFWCHYICVQAHEGIFKPTEDSVLVKKGHCMICRVADDINYIRLIFNDYASVFFIAPATQFIHIDYKKPYLSQIKGGTVYKENNDILDLCSTTKKISFQAMMSMKKGYYNYIQHRKDSSVLKNFMRVNQDAHQVRDSCSLIQNKKILDYTENHISSDIAPMLIYYVISAKDTLGNMQMLYDRLSDKQRSTPNGKALLSEVQQYMANKYKKENKNILDFERNDIYGNPVRISQFNEKKYILLYFWAPWCGPCLKNINKLKDWIGRADQKDIALIWICCDNDENKWKQTIRKYAVSAFTHVLSKGIQPSDKLSDDFGIKYIPTYILLDSNRKIISNCHSLEEIEHVLQSSRTSQIVKTRPE